jgi:hypothetical protein
MLNPLPSNGEVGFPLQRSEMFIDNALGRSPARQRSAMFSTLARKPSYVSLRWSEENLLVVAPFINFSPLWGEEHNVLLRFQLEFADFPFRS